MNTKVSFGALQVRLRQAAKTALEERGFKTVKRPGKGIRPGARLVAKPARGPAVEVAVRTSRERALGFSRLDNGDWRTLQKVQLVLAVVPDRAEGAYQLLAFESKTLKSWYGRALKALESAGRSPELAVPVFIALDEQSKKNVGHNIVGLKKAALWSVSIGLKQLEDQKLSEDQETFVNRVKREFAERMEVDVSKVWVKFGLLA
jgi:hypothetical protein